MSAPPVVLVHGFASSFERNWRQPGWVDLLADMGRRVVEVDLPGHGRAPRSHDPADYADLEGWVAAALPTDGQVDAIGFSLGGRVLLGLAADQPERFRRMVLGGVGENVLRDEDSEGLARAVEGTTESTADVVTEAFARFARSPGNDPLALAACLRRPVIPLDADRLAAVRLPVLVVLGDRDFAGPGHPLVERLPEARLVTLRGVDHLGTASHMGFIEAALDFLGLD